MEACRNDCSNVYLYNKQWFVAWSVFAVVKRFWVMYGNICECVYYNRCYGNKIIFC
jgi:hypothetical protein